MSSQPFMLNSRKIAPRQIVRPIVFVLMLSFFSVASASLAYGQFTLTVSVPLNNAVNPNGSATAVLDLQPNPSTDPVTLTCAVTTSIPNPVSLPTCEVSPATPITPPATPSLTVSTTSATSFGSYTITVTGTNTSLSTQTLNLTLTVTNVTEDYTLAVLPTTATPSPVKAGTTATSTVTVTPIGSYSNHQITLSCLSITPVVSAAPVCSFNPPFVTVTSGSAPTSTLTITTLGPIPTTRLPVRRVFYALWLLIPGFAFIGLGRSLNGRSKNARSKNGRSGNGRARNLRKRLMGFLLLMAVASGLLFMPACSSSNNTNNPSGETTPKNTYTFTLTGADETGAAPGNTTCTTTGTVTTCTGPTVSLTVD